MATRIGIVTTAAIVEARTRYLIGLVDSVVRAVDLLRHGIRPIPRQPEAATRPVTMRARDHRSQLAGDAEHDNLRKRMSPRRNGCCHIDLQRKDAASEECGQTHDRQGKIADPHDLLKNDRT